MELSLRYLPLGGSRRAYYDTVRRQVMSRRQYLKRQAIFPHSTGTAAVPRSDKGARHRIIHRSPQRPQPFVKTVTLAHDLVAEIHPRTASTSLLVIRQVAVAPLNLEQRGKRRCWHCGIGGCPNQYDNLTKMAHHCYAAHYLDACCFAGVVAPTILPVHEIHTSTRKSRMPWRVEAPEIV